jgi:tetratricopeptide (TPR) repeat protein
MPDQSAYRRALRALELAVEKDPRYALGWALLAEIHVDSQSHGFEGPDDAIEIAHRYVHKALHLDPCCQHAHSASAYIHFVLGEHEAAVEAADRAIELNPNSAYQVAVSAFWMGLSGELDRACKFLDQVEELLPYLPGWLHHVPLLWHLEREDFLNAHAEAMKYRTPQVAWDPLLRASTAALADKKTMASVAHREFTELFPKVAEDPESYIRSFMHNDEHVAILLRGLERASVLVRP